MIILGLFDALDDAREVLVQLASAPLDTDALEVVHRRPDVQAQLMALGGVRPGSTLPLAGASGALLGGAIGALGADSVFAMLSPLLAVSAGVLVGGAAGVAAGALSRRLRLPEPHADEILKAIEDGATAIVIRTSNAANARVLADLFARHGSRQLEPVPGVALATEPQAISDGASLPADETAWGASGPPVARSGAYARIQPPVATPVGAQDDGGAPATAGSSVDRSTQFWASGGTPARAAPAASVRPPAAASVRSPAAAVGALFSRLRGNRDRTPAGLGGPAGGPAKPADETLFAPPWRRGVPAENPQPVPWSAINPPSPAEPGDDVPSVTWGTYGPGTESGPEPDGWATSAADAPSPSWNSAPEAPPGHAWSDSGDLESPEPWRGTSGDASAEAWAAGPGADFAPWSPPDDRDLAALGLSSRVAGALVMAGITTVSDLRAKSAEGEERLLELRGIGPSALAEIRRKLGPAPTGPRPAAPAPFNVSMPRSALDDPDVDLIAAAPPPLDILDALPPEADAVAGQAVQLVPQSDTALSPYGRSNRAVPAEPVEPSYKPDVAAGTPTPPAPSDGGGRRGFRPAVRVSSASPSTSPAARPSLAESADVSAPSTGPSAAGGVATSQPTLASGTSLASAAPPRSTATAGQGVGERRRGRSSGQLSTSTDSPNAVFSPEPAAPESRPPDPISPAFASADPASPGPTVPPEAPAGEPDPPEPAAGEDAGIDWGQRASRARRDVSKDSSA